MRYLPYFWRSAVHTGLPPSTPKHARVPLLAPAQTCLPSVMHDGDASDTSAPDGLPYRFLPVPESFSFHFSLPSVPMHMSTMSSPSTEVTKIFSPHTIGVDEPIP